MIACLIRRGCLFALAWWIITGGQLVYWPLGGVGIAVATAASLWLLPPDKTPQISLTGLFGFICYFIVQSLRGGIQVARLALQLRLRLRPALLELPLTLPLGLPRLLFTATLGLMPGTLGVRLSGDVLYVHVLDVELPITREANLLAGHISRLFGARS